jgi:hypothetical protein
MGFRYCCDMGIERYRDGAIALITGPRRSGRNEMKRRKKMGSENNSQRSNAENVL